MGSLFYFWSTECSPETWTLWKESRGRQDDEWLRYTFCLQICARLLWEKDIWTVFSFFFFSIMISDSRTHIKQWKVGEIYLRWIWRALHLFKERSRILSRITLLPLGVCSRHRGRGPALGACGGRITLKETEIPSHLQKSGLFLFVSDS